MPQKGHKTPFSAKQKKEQLKAKKERLKNVERDEFGMQIRHQKKHGSKGYHDPMRHEDQQRPQCADGGAVKKINQQPVGVTGTGYDPNRYRLHFLHESREEIQRRKDLARLPFDNLSEESLEIDIEDVYKPGSVLDMPKRPPWDYKMSKVKLEAKEEAYFRKYVDDIMAQHDTYELSYFEMNLETWRQLWRVLEMSDVILLITDIRHPALHFSPSLYNYVAKELKKQLILVLNKVDLAAPGLVIAWKGYFREKFPELHVIYFTSFPKDKEEQEMLSDDPGKVLHKRRKRLRYNAVGPKQLLEVCENIVHGKVELEPWRDKIIIDASDSACDSDCASEPDTHYEEGDTSFQEHEAFKGGVLTIGCCGYPNVGKSSLINGLVGKKVVSVSKTPGHTKHFQTIFLTPTVKLCDSPGLVFPSLVEKPMQILAGIYPIAQVREPFSAVQYLSERIPVQQLLRLKHPEAGDEPNVQHEWSAMDICDAWAEKRGFLTAKAARPDTFRAANNILRLAVDGRLNMCTRPPLYTREQESWSKAPEAIEISKLQELHRETKPSKYQTGTEDSFILSDSEDEQKPKEQRRKNKDEKEEDSEEEPTPGVSNPFELLADENE